MTVSSVQFGLTKITVNNYYDKNVNLDSFLVSSLFTLHQKVHEPRFGDMYAHHNVPRNRRDYYYPRVNIKQVEGNPELPIVSTKITTAMPTWRKFWNPPKTLEIWIDDVLLEQVVQKKNKVDGFINQLKEVLKNAGFKPHFQKDLPGELSEYTFRLYAP